jgi:Tfp pilus assembly protein PilO
MRDRVIIVSVAFVALLAAFYFMILSPKRDKASQLGDEITELQSSIDEQEQVAAFGEQARAEFPRYYGRVVVLGKAVPEGADSSSMIVQLSDVSKDSNTEFRGLKLAEGGGAAPASSASPATPTTGTPSTETSTTPSTETTTSTTSTTPTDSTTPAPAAGAPASTATTAPAPATETMAASLPIGATVGAAGLPILPYKISLAGSYFEIADFMAGVDRLVHLNEGRIAADGRLLTMDGFSLVPIPILGGEQRLAAEFALTSYVTPAEQGLTGGATPGGPAPSPAQPSTTPTATPVVSP